MNLRSRVIAGAEEQDEEEEVLIEQEEEEEMATEKKGVAGDERNIAVLLFLYVLQVGNIEHSRQFLFHCTSPPLNS